MDTSNSKPTDQAPTDTSVESDDWRDQLQAYTRETIKNAIADTLKRHLPLLGDEELHELNKIVERVEEEIYTAATSQAEYHKMIFLSYSSLDTRLQIIRTSYPGSQVMQQLKDLEQHLLIRGTSDNIQQTTNAGGLQGSSALPHGSDLQQPPMTNVAGQNLNWQNFQNMSSAQQNYFNGQRYNNNPHNFQLRLQQQSLMDQQMKLSSLLQQAQQLLQSQQLQQAQQLNGQSLNMSNAYRNQQSQQLQQSNGQSYSNQIGYGSYIQQQQQLQHYRMQQQGLIGQQNRLSGLLQQPSQQLIGHNLNLQNFQNMSTDQGMLQSNKMLTQQQNQQMLLSSLQLSQQLIGQILNLQSLQNMSIDQGTLQSNKMPTQQQIQQGSAYTGPTQVQQLQQLPQQVMTPQMPAQVQQSQPQLPQQVTLPDMQSSQLGQLQL